jgi:glycogen debranching enzyme
LSDIIRVKDKYYVLASSALADDRTRVLKYGDTFGVFNRYGDIETVGDGQLGLFYAETRHLSRMTFRLHGKAPLLLSSTIQDDNAFLSVDLTNLDSTAANGHVSISRGIVHIYRSKFLDDGLCYEHLRITNYGLDPIDLALSFDFGADFADIFEVRGTPRRKKGQLLPTHMENDSVLLSYQGLDDVLRTTCLRFSPQPTSIFENSARFNFKLQPKEESVISLTTVCERNSAAKNLQPYKDAFLARRTQCDHRILGNSQVSTSNKRFNIWLSRSEADLQMLIQGNPEAGYPYAGVPWFNTVFGRDGIITALECLWLAPSITEGVLTYLASTQATDKNAEQDSEPGKIVHEMRRGEMAALKEVPFGKYYGSVDSTPLFVLLAGAYFRRTNNLPFVKKIWSNIVKALEWIDRYGDSDGDGFIEYARKTPEGLLQQGWKDSGDSIMHADGRIAEAPIALCEVQSYVYAAKLSAAAIARALGEADLATQLDQQATELQQRFEQSFWNEELRSYVLALDGKKEQCRVRSSNAGHALFCKIADRPHAAITADTLLSESMFSGWGVRTLAAGEVRYNPMSYHNGSVWPHDNALIALGLSLYGFQSKAVQILSGLYEASLQVDLNRLPELFCGFHKRAESHGPTLYPVACAPQAWASGSVYLLLRAILGITINAPEKLIRFENPALPINLDEVMIQDLQIGDATVDILVRRYSDGVAIDVPRRRGEVEVIKAV